MVEPGTSFSLLNKKTRTMQIAFAILIIVGGLLTTQIMLNFSAELAEATGPSKFFVLFLPIIFPVLIIQMLFFPYRYIVTENGVSIESVIKKNPVKFSDIDHVVLDIAPNQKKPYQRIHMSCEGKKYYMVGLAADFDTLRDHILASVDPTIVVDHREEVGKGKTPPARN